MPASSFRRGAPPRTGGALRAGRQRRGRRPTGSSCRWQVLDVEVNLDETGCRSVWYPYPRNLFESVVAREEAYARSVNRFVGEFTGTPTMNVLAGEHVGVQTNPDRLHLFDQNETPSTAREEYHDHL